MLVAAFVLVMLNRDSEAVVKAAVPVALGMISVLCLVFAFNRPEPITKVFPIVWRSLTMNPRFSGIARREDSFARNGVGAVLP